MICQAIEDREMCRRAAEIGQDIENENGVGKAVGIIERYLAEFQANSSKDENRR
jgi:UDP:flavonoid glycosyltransferase YjiC (YdhE family)